MNERNSIQVSVIIPAYQRFELLAEVVAALDSNAPSYFEILIVVDGCSQTDRLARRLNTSHPCRVWNTGYSDGFGVSIARNVGARHARGRQLVFLDSDSIPSSQHVQIYFDEFRDDTLLIGSIHHVDEQDHSRMLIKEFRPPFALQNWEYDQAEAASYCWTANISVPRKAFYEVGGFDMAFVGNGGADSDFGERFMRYFGRVSFVDAPVRHCGVSSGLRAFVINGEFHESRFFSWLANEESHDSRLQYTPIGGTGVENREKFDMYRNSGRYDGPRDSLIVNGGSRFFEE